MVRVRVRVWLTFQNQPYTPFNLFCNSTYHQIQPYRLQSSTKFDLSTIQAYARRSSEVLLTSVNPFWHNVLMSVVNYVN